MDFGKLTRMRSQTFEDKEPETLRWIDNFLHGAVFMDVGANVGLYSLYAASRGCVVVAAEPDALNFALLNQNIRLNRAVLGKRIRAFPVAFHDCFRISDLNISNAQWGAALSSFDSSTNFKGDTFDPKASQGCVGVSVDDFVSQLGMVVNHMKIDVDGNEFRVLSGATRTLSDGRLQSVLVELDERHPDYQASVNLLTAAGLTLTLKTQSPEFARGEFDCSYNHIFWR